MTLLIPKSSRKNPRAVILRSALRDEGSQPSRLVTKTQIPAIPVAPRLQAGIFGFLFSLGGRSFSADITTKKAGLQPLRNPLHSNSTTTKKIHIIPNNSTASSATATPACVPGSLPSKKTPNSPDAQ